MPSQPPPDPAPAQDPRVLFAAERTLLAWIRTGIAMMGFGFIVARFGLFLRELAAARDTPPTTRPGGVSLGLGTALVVLGVVMLTAATVKYRRTLHRLDRNQPLRPGPLSLETLTATALAILGTVMAAYLLTVR